MWVREIAYRFKIDGRLYRDEGEAKFLTSYSQIGVGVDIGRTDRLLRGHSIAKWRQIAKPDVAKQLRATLSA